MSRSPHRDLKKICKTRLVAHSHAKRASAKQVLQTLLQRVSKKLCKSA